MLDTGTTLSGYRVDGVLGEGGMGVVYRATQLSLNRTIALKVLATELSDDPTFRERFRREGLLQAKIDHPHIVTVYEAGETEFGLFLAMRLVEGPTLKDIILSDDAEPRRAIRILRQVADALDTAHEVGLIHRDIKPQNILIGARDHAYLADFGLTRGPDEASSLTDTGQFVGTIDYVSPEQMRGQLATPQSDVYALAGVLYECLTRKVPFQKPTEAGVLYAHMTEPPPKPTESQPDLPAPLDDVIAAGMAKEAEARPSTATDLIAAAERAYGLSPPSTQLPAVGVPTEPGAEIAAGAPTVAAGVLGAATVAAGTAPAGVAPPPARTIAIGVAVAAVAAAVIGFVIGGSGGEDSAGFTSSASAGDVQLSFPDGWNRSDQPPDIPGLRFGDPIALRPSGGSGDYLAAGTVAASGARLLPASLERRLPGGAPKSDSVKLGEIEALRYTGLRPEGLEGRMTLFAIPIAEGVVTLVCVAGGAAGNDGFEDRCGQVAASLQLTGAKPFPVGPSPEYAQRLSRAISTLSKARTADLRRLRGAGSRGAQARAADRLARDYDDTASAIRAISNGGLVSPRDRAANDELAAGVAAGQRGYRALAAAARGGDSGAYSAARASVQQADRAIDRGLAALRRLGYAAG